jgi:hypothetical protein
LSIDFASTAMIPKALLALGDYWLSIPLGLKCGKYIYADFPSDLFCLPLLLIKVWYLTWLSKGLLIESWLNWALSENNGPFLPKSFPLVSLVNMLVLFDGLLKELRFERTPIIA